MAKKHMDRLAQLNQGLSEPKKGEGAETHSTPKVTQTLIQRETALSNIASGKRRDIQLFLVKPDKVRMWSEHNRDYSLLNPQRCADLIEGFRRAGKQEFPAIVRRLSGDEAYDYELICGARRHWTANYLGWDLLIEVRDLNDRQAFTLQDLENRDREDISDYERALDYKKALARYFAQSVAYAATLPAKPTTKKKATTKKAAKK